MFLELCSHTSQNRHGCRFRSNAYKDVCLLRWRTYRKPISEFLEHLASYNGADMHKYNTLYTRKLSWHVLTPTSFSIMSLSITPLSHRLVLKKIKTQRVSHHAEAWQAHCRCSEHRIERPAKKLNPHTCCKRYTYNIVYKRPEQVLMDIAECSTA